MASNVMELEHKCALQKCKIVLPAPKSRQRYAVASYEHSLSNLKEAAGFLERTIWGLTIAENSNLAAKFIASNKIALIAEHTSDQLNDITSLKKNICFVVEKKECCVATTSYGV
eukprot:8776361-Ditylum_brightwellii.AAC.1